MSVTITVDGKKIEAQEGALLIDVCRDAGIDIPHFCYHPGLGPDGNCRMCQVEFISERGNRLGISCKAVVMDGMEVQTKSDAALRARASVEEFLLLNHPLDCPICDKAGECTLQDYYMAHDLEDSRQNFTRFRKGKAMDIGPTLVLDQERCVLCDRCVRFLKDVAGDEQLFIAGRGHEAYITTFPGKEVTSPYSLNTVDLCPVGALTSKDFRFSSPNWFLKNTPTVCTTCSRGCSMQMQVKDDKVRRFRPRHNPDVNGYWACDEGRLNYKFVNENRVEEAVIRRDGHNYIASREEVVAEARQLLGYTAAGPAEGSAAKKSVFVASASATLEEMYLMRRLANRVGGTAFVARHNADGEADSILRQADRHANVRGAELLGLSVLDLRPGANGAGGEATSALGQDGVLFLVGFGAEISSGVEGLSKAAAKTFMITSNANALSESADVLYPGGTFAEKDGLLVNFEGHVQRLKAGIRRQIASEWQLLDAMCASLDGATPSEFISNIRQMISEEPAFKGTNLVNVGVLGVRLESQAVS